MQNPFSLTFGKEPKSLIDRTIQSSEIIESFESDNPDFQVCMITGVRGSGKTVLLTTIAKEFKKRTDWICVDLSPERDIIHALAAELCNRPDLVQIFKEAKINLSIFGLSFGLENVSPITDTVVALDKIIEKLTKKGKKILITIDEATANRHIREFVSQFQIFMRKNYNVFLLMTGLYENIYELQNQKTLTFLYRAPKIELQPLSIAMIAGKYKEIFNLSENDSIAMAKQTKGYPFAYQVLGYLCYKNKTFYTQNIEEFDTYLEQFVYEKIWNELSANDRTVLKAMTEQPLCKVECIRNNAGMDSNIFAVYRDRLLKKGLIASPSYGYLSYVLPRFCAFILRTC